MTLKSTRIFSGRVVTLDVAEVRLPNGHVAEMEIVGHPGGAEKTPTQFLATTGQSAARWESLGRVISSPGVFAEVVHLYLARELTPVAAAPERDEVFEVVWVPLESAARRALDGDIEDAKSVIALLRAARRLGLSS